MNLICMKAGRQRRNFVQVVSFLALAVTCFAGIAGTQAQAADAMTANAKADAQTYKTIYLTGPTLRTDALEIMNDLRNMLPTAKLYYLPSQNAISMVGTPEDFALEQKILLDLDRARKTYRLTYTITETDNGQRVGARRVALIVVEGEKADLKQGNRVPLVTGVTDAGSTMPSTQVQYIDLGLNIRASLDGAADGLSLHTTIEQSSITDEKSGMGAQDPVIHQTLLDTTSTLVQGKPVLLGSLDIPGSTQHMEIEVSSEPVP